jgi:tripartite-type tricarboxylate transporter receptor subunit TctC
MKVTAASWFEGPDPVARVLVQVAGKRHPDLPNVPLAREFLKNSDQEKLLDIFALTSEVTRPFTLPPGVPAERVRVVRQVFMEALQDPEARAEAEKSQLFLAPQDYQVVERFVDTTLSIDQKEAEAYAVTLGLK